MNKTTSDKSKKMKPSLLFGSGLVIAIFTMGVLFMFQNLSDPEVDIEQARKINESLYYQAEAYEGKTQSLVNLEHNALPKSLHGVSNLKVFRQSHDGNLMGSYAIREYFDTHLSTLGERDLETIIGGMQQEIISSLDDPARSAALSLLKRYVDFKLALANFDTTFETTSYADPNTGTINPDALAGHFSELKSLRESYFDAQEYEQFFADEDAQTHYMIETLRINQDDYLSATEKASLIEQAALTLPEHVRESRESVMKHVNLRAQVETLRSNGASAEDIYQARKQQLGTEAANALAELDQKRQRWAEKLDTFAGERRDVLSSSLSAEDKSDAIETLLIAHFDHTEIKRARALMNDGRMD